MGKVKKYILLGYRYQRKRLKRSSKNTLAIVLMKIFKFQWATKKRIQRIKFLLGKGFATAVGTAIAIFFLSTADQLDIPRSDIHLTSAGIIGGALALILSLSIIPAQKAAEAFSTAILTLYSNDFSMRLVFLVLTMSAMASILLSTTWTSFLNENYSIAFQFVVLGASFDALRHFYMRTLTLLMPQTALQLVVRECRTLIKDVSRAAERSLRIYALSDPSHMDQTLTRAVLFEASQINPNLRSWITQLDEFAHKGVAKKDTQAVSDIVSAIQTIGTEYAEARRTSIVLRPDLDNPFSGGETDISKVLGAVYESIKEICQDAARHHNEAIVRRCIRGFGQLTTHALSMVPPSRGKRKDAPLAFSPSFYLDLCVDIALKAKMPDAVYQSVDVLSAVISSIEKDVDASPVQDKTLETLFKVSVAGYGDPFNVSCFPAVTAMLFAAQRDIQMHGYQDNPVLVDVMRYLEALVPFEIGMEKAGKRVIQIFPPYSITSYVSVPLLLNQIAHQVEPIDPERIWLSPFHEFCEASENIVHHYRSIAKINFRSSLLRKWVINSIFSCIDVHTALLDNTKDAERFHDEVSVQITWFVHAIGFFFAEKDTSHDVNDTAKNLSILGMKFLNRGRAELAMHCAEVISYLISKYAASDAKQFTFADIWTNLEILSRAADALGFSDVKDKCRAMMVRPKNIPDQEWVHFDEAIRIRTEQLEENLEKVGRDYGLRDDPISMLGKILGRT